MMPITAMEATRRLSNPADADWFWGVIGHTVTPNEVDQLKALEAQFRPMTDQDLVNFIALFNSLSVSMYSWRLWAAAYIMNGGCSDDGFTDFRAWLISRGRAVAEAAMADPESLAALHAEIDSATFEAFGHAMVTEFRNRADDVFPSRLGDQQPAAPDDRDWSFDFADEAEMRRRLPRLWAEYHADD